MVWDDSPTHYHSNVTEIINKIEVVFEFCLDCSFTHMHTTQAIQTKNISMGYFTSAECTECRRFIESINRDGFRHEQWAARV